MKIIHLIIITTLLITNHINAQEKNNTPQTKEGTVTANTLNIRSKPATHYETVCQLKKGDKVTIIDENDEWYKIKPPIGTKAFIAQKFINNNTITKNKVRIHCGSAVVFTTYAYLNKGDKVTPINTPQDGFQQIKVPNNVTVWVCKEFIKVPKPKIDKVDNTKIGKADNPKTDTEKTDDNDKTKTDNTKTDTEKADNTKIDDTKTDKVDDKKTDGIKTDNNDNTKTDNKTDNTKTDNKADNTKTDKADYTKTDNNDNTKTDNNTGEIPITYGDYTGKAIHGYIFPLKTPIPNIATHVVSIYQNKQLIPKYYLVSNLINLKKWEKGEVLIFGKEKKYQGWKLSVLEIDSIQAFQK